MFDKATETFADAMNLAKSEFYIEAVGVFKDIVSQYPDHELADDALFNAGMCYFHLNLFEQAITLFNKVITDYPDAEIHHGEDDTSFGKTAAKCHYAIINCYLGMAKASEAEQELSKLNKYTDAYELTPLGEKLSYQQLGQKAVESYKQFNI